MIIGLIVALVALIAGGAVACSRADARARGNSYGWAKCRTRKCGKWIANGRYCRACRKQGRK